VFVPRGFALSFPLEAFVDVALVALDLASSAMAFLVVELC